MDKSDLNMGMIKDVLLKSTLAKSFGVYTFARVINACIPFLLLPIMTTYLTPTDYGIISMAVTVAAFVMPFVTLRVEDAVVRRFYYKDDDISVYIGNSVFIVFVMCAIVTLIVSSFNGIIYKYTQVPVIVLVIIPLYCAISYFKSLVLYYWQVNQQPKKFAIFSIIATVLEISIALLLVVAFHFNWVGRALSLFISATLCASYAVLYLKHHNMIKLRFNKEMLLHAVKYGSGLIPAGIGATLMIMVNRSMLTNISGISETGLYGVAYSFAGLLGFITGSFNNAFLPWLFPKLNLNNYDDKLKIVKFTYLYFVLLFILGIILFIAIKWLLPIFVSSSFEGSIIYVPWLILGRFFEGCYYMVCCYIMYAEKTYYTGFITIAVSLISIGVNFFAISYFGPVGAAISFAISQALLFFIMWVFSARIYKMPWLLK